MADKLDKYELTKRDSGKWALEPEAGGRAKALFDKKADALKRGAMADALGKAGGSVKVRKTDGTYQQERTYPRGKDPKGSKG